jgi:glucose-fructose oxidoreductase
MAARKSVLKKASRTLAAAASKLAPKGAGKANGKGRPAARAAAVAAATAATAAAATAAAAAAPRRAAAGGGGRKVGYAVVGLGHFAQNAVLPAFANAKKNSRLVALVSGDVQKQKALGKKYQVPVFTYEQFDEVLAHPEVDAVYIALPNHLHAEYAIRAARAGVHVLCEKPLALTEGQCREMIRAASDADVRLMTAYRLHFEAANLAAVEAVRSGSIGEPRTFASSFTFQVAKDNIRTDLMSGGGVIWDIGMYCINATRYLFRAEPTEVFCFRAKGKDARFAETEEGASAVLRFPDDRLATFTVSFGAASTSTYTLVGTQGSVRLDNAYDYMGKMELTVQAGKKTRKKTFPERDQLAPELLYFSTCVLENKVPEPDGWEGLADVRIIAALYESARLNRPVELPAFDPGARPTGAQTADALPPHYEDKVVNAEAPVQG